MRGSHQVCGTMPMYQETVDVVVVVLQTKDFWKPRRPSAEESSDCRHDCSDIRGVMLQQLDLRYNSVKRTSLGETKHSYRIPPFLHSVCLRRIIWDKSLSICKWKVEMLCCFHLQKLIAKKWWVLFWGVAFKDKLLMKLMYSNSEKLYFMLFFFLRQNLVHRIR